ncbi:MAG TPA: class I SAM-dependent methyltransferase [Limnobacter sp.]|nr:class I SAM-dependent methyltransferase [Limnobacter sp.]
MTSPHADSGLAPSRWVVDCLQAIQGLVQGRPAGAPPLRALDLACGGGRHALYLASLGFEVHAVDRQVPATAWPVGVTFQQMDLEQGDWPLHGQQYDLIVVTNYLYRPHFQNLLACLKSEKGVLVYETFMDGNARFGSPKNPDFLLQPAELLLRLAGLNILRFEQGQRQQPGPAMIQRAMAITGGWSGIQSETIKLT